MRAAIGGLATIAALVAAMPIGSTAAVAAPVPASLSPVAEPEPDSPLQSVRDAAEAAEAANQNSPLRSARNAAEAARMAAQAGERVEVLSERTELSQVFAKPDGGLTVEAGVVPERVQRPDGSWADLDLRLSVQNGVVRPAVSATDIEFSNGGSGPLVTLRRGADTFTMTWTGGTLPVPELVAPSDDQKLGNADDRELGNAAIYRDVVPGVDLVMRAVETGFTHVLVIKSKAAALANAALRQIKLQLGGTADLRREADGTYTVSAQGEVLASAQPPVMWDSSTGSAPTEPDAGGPDDDPSTAAGPGDEARVAPVGASLSAGRELVLQPDLNLLATGTYPIFIDPDWSTGKKRWAYSTNNNTNNTDTSRARVGKDPDGREYRPYFEFPTTKIKDKYVHSAYVQMVADHTYSCTDTWTHMYTAAPIRSTPRTKWNSAKKWYLKHISAGESHANEGRGCHDSPQPDMTVNFGGGAVKDAVQTVATKGASSVTIAFSAANEDGAHASDGKRWKKFFPKKAKLILDVDAKPGKPKDLAVNGVVCGNATIGIGTTAAKFSATMPDADEGQSVKATWRLQRKDGSTWTNISAPPVSSTSADKAAHSKAATGIVNGQTYRFAVKGTDEAPYNQESPDSDWCTFTVDTADPTVTGAVTALPTGPGKPGTFTLTSPDTDVVKFRYGWNAAITEIPATTTAVNGVPTKTAQVTLTAPKYGQNVLNLQAIDSTANVGDGSLVFDVDVAARPAAHWALETYPGYGVDQAVADQRGDRAGDNQLKLNAVSWTDKGRLIGGAQATFAGNGSIETPAVIDTTKSYGVAAWVRLDNMDNYQNLVSQDGNHSANFQLQLRVDDRNADGKADKSFCFTTRVADVDAAGIAASACGINTAVTGRWTHVAGSFDAAEKKVRVWVDGVLKQELATSAGWASTGSLRIGNRRYTAAHWLDGLFGAVAHVQVFDRALVQEDFVGDKSDPAIAVEPERGMLDPIKIGQWTFEGSRSCTDPAGTDACSAEDGTRFGRRLGLTKGVEVLASTRGNYAEFDTAPVGVENPAHGTTREYARSQRNTAAAGTAPVWADGSVVRTDQSFTVHARVRVDSITSTMTAIAAKGSKQSAFYVGTRKSTVNSVTAHRFEIMTVSPDADLGETYR
ncbi:MAG TPA: LamG domain-containing protein, partial [Actinoplanes sp.]|nr:LamG domain-containing protein [Actinoplanes sp.]